MKITPLFLLSFAAFLSVGCGKVKLPFIDQPKATPVPVVVQPPKPAATPVPDAVALAPAEATPAPTPKPKPTPKPAPPVVDTSGEVVVLCYHRLEGKAGGTLSIEASLFEKQMQEIKDAGLPVISMKDFLAWRRSEKSLPKRSVLITIDDGYVSGYQVGVPILKKHGFTATFFVYTKYVNTGGKSITWAQLEDLRDSGFDIGCHTISHLDLRRKPSGVAGDYDSWLKAEVEQSKEIIEDHLGIKCATFAYPFGHNNAKVQEAVSAAGFEAAFTTYGQRLGHATHAMTLGRYDVTTKDAQGRDSFSVAISFSGMAAPSRDMVLAQDAAVAMVTQPLNNEVIKDQKPAIGANLASMGDLDPASVQMRIGGIGMVTAKYDEDGKSISYKPSQPLPPGRHTVIVDARSGGQKKEVRWTFTIDPNATQTGVPAVELPAEKPKKR